MGEVLQRSVGVLQEGLGRPPGQGAGLQEGLLLLLVLVDQLGDEGSSVVVTGCVSARSQMVRIIRKIELMTFQN